MNWEIGELVKVLRDNVPREYVNFTQHKFVPFKTKPATVPEIFEATLLKPKQGDVQQLQPKPSAQHANVDLQYDIPVREWLATS